MSCIVYTDGASSGNPGPGWAMWVVENPKSQIPITQKRERLEHCTNNEAEYLAVIHALQYLQRHSALWNSEQLIEFLTKLAANPWILLKILFLVAFLIYVAFAVIVVRQVNLMIKTLDGVLNLPLRMIAWIHLLAALIVFVLAVVIL